MIAKSEKIKMTVIDVLVALCLINLCVCAMLLDDVYGEPVPPIGHVALVILSAAGIVFAVWHIGRKLYRLWKNRDLLTGEPIVG